MVTIRHRRSLRTSMNSLVPPEEEDHAAAQLQIIQKALRIPDGQVIDGEPWPPIFTPANVRSAKEMRPRPTDIFICTYPKCGTTWLQHIVHQLLDKTEYESNSEAIEEAFVDDEDDQTTNRNPNAMCFVSPMIERMGAAYADTIKTPRVLKSHFTYDNIPKGNGAKYIFVVRNPKDCLTSYYHHHKMFKIYNFEDGEFDVFYELFMTGKLGFGDYFHHLMSWIEGMNKKEENILFLKYEDMMLDLAGAVLEIARFLGGQSEVMVRDQEVLNKIVENSSLSAMKKNQQRWFPNEQLHKGEFIRKGGTRDWKNHFSYDQSRRMDNRFRKFTEDTVAEEWWRREMSWDESQSPIDMSSSPFPSSLASSGFFSEASTSLVSSYDSIEISNRTRISSISSTPFTPERPRVDSLQFQIEIREEQTEQ